MKKVNWVKIVVAVFAAALFAVVLIQLNKPKAKAPTIKTTTVNVSSTKPACDILTSSDAAKLLGTSTINKYVPKSKGPESGIDVTECNYYKKDGSAGATLIVRAGTNTSGILSNKAAFNPTPSGSTSISGVGESAFWDPYLGTLNILKNNTWYAVKFGPIDNDKRNPSQTQQLVNLVNSKL